MPVRCGTKGHARAGRGRRQSGRPVERLLAGATTHDGLPPRASIDACSIDRSSGGRGAWRATQSVRRAGNAAGDDLDPVPGPLRRLGRDGHRATSAWATSTMPSCPSLSSSCRWSWSSAGSGRNGGVGAHPRHQQRFDSSSVARRSPSSSSSRARSRAWRPSWPPPVARSRAGHNARRSRNTADRRRAAHRRHGDGLPRDRRRRPRLAPDPVVPGEPRGGSAPDVFDDVETLTADLAPHRARRRPSSASAPRPGGRRTGSRDRCAPSMAGVLRHRHRLRRRAVDVAQPGRGRVVAQRGHVHRADLCRPGRRVVIAAYATSGAISSSSGTTDLKHRLPEARGATIETQQIVERRECPACHRCSSAMRDSSTA